MIGEHRLTLSEFRDKQFSAGGVRFAGLDILKKVPDRLRSLQPKYVDHPDIKAPAKFGFAFTDGSYALAQFYRDEAEAVRQNDLLELFRDLAVGPEPLGVWPMTQTSAVRFELSPPSVALGTLVGESRLPQDLEPLAELVTRQILAVHGLEPGALAGHISGLAWIDQLLQRIATTRVAWSRYGAKSDASVAVLNECAEYLVNNGDAIGSIKPVPTIGLPSLSWVRVPFSGLPLFLRFDLRMADPLLDIRNLFHCLNTKEGKQLSPLIWQHYAEQSGDDLLNLEVRLGAIEIDAKIARIMRNLRMDNPGRAEQRLPGLRVLLESGPDLLLS